MAINSERASRMSFGSLAFLKVVFAISFSREVPVQNKTIVKSFANRIFADQIETKSSTNRRRANSLD